jgi:hypothetical protein
MAAYENRPPRSPQALTLCPDGLCSRAGAGPQSRWSTGYSHVLRRALLRSDGQRHQARHARDQRGDRSRSSSGWRHGLCPRRNLPLLQHPPEEQRRNLPRARLHHPRRGIAQARRDHRPVGRHLRPGRAQHRMGRLPGLRPQPLAQLALLGRRAARPFHHWTRPDLRQGTQLRRRPGAPARIRSTPRLRPGVRHRPAPAPNAGHAAAGAPLARRLSHVPGRAARRRQQGPSGFC